MGLQALREGAGSGILKYALMSLLLMAVGGLAFTDVGGFFSDGVSTNDVAIVGDESISIVTFDRTLRRRLSGSQITPQMAYEIGYLDQILNKEIQTHLMKQAAADAGIKISKEYLAQKIGEMLPTISQPGETPSMALQRLLRSSGLSEQRFFKILERDQTAGYISTLVSSGFSRIPEGLAQDLYAYNNEKRAVQLVLFPYNQSTDFETPTQERISNYYEAAKQSFVIPETRDIKLIKIKEGQIRNTIKINEENIRASYDKSIESYTQPETRKIEQAIFATEEHAKNAYALIKAGKSFKTATAGDKSKDGEGRALTTMTEQSFSADQMMTGLSEKAFTFEGNGVLEPIKTSLGWSLLKINGSAPAKIKPYNSVKKSIKAELIENEIADQISLLADELDDALASGATPEDIAQEIDIEITTHKGISPKGHKSLAQYGDTAKNIAASAFDLFTGESSSVFETKNGDIMAVNLAAIIEVSYKPFEDVKEDIRKKLHLENRNNANKAMTRTLADELRAQENPNLDSFAKSQNKYLQILKGIKRSGAFAKPLSQSAAQKIFAAEIGNIIAINLEKGSAIIKIVSSKLPDASKIKTKNLEAITAQTIQETGQEALSLFINEERKKKGVKTNKLRLKTAYAPTDNQ